jgi:hypothetical protein
MPGKLCAPAQMNSKGECPVYSYTYPSDTTKGTPMNEKKPIVDLPFKFTKDTKRTQVFDNEQFGVIYIPKAFLPGSAEGKKLRVVITEE